MCALNGFVELQHGATLGSKLFFGKRDCSRIGFVDKIRNTVTNEMRRHDEYFEIFQHLKKAIRRSLVYSTFNTFLDGHIEEDKRVQLMTEKAFQAARAGLQF